MYEKVTGTDENFRFVLLLTFKKGGYFISDTFRSAALCDILSPNRHNIPFFLRGPLQWSAGEPRDSTQSTSLPIKKKTDAPKRRHSKVWISSSIFVIYFFFCSKWSGELCRWPVCACGIGTFVKMAQNLILYLVSYFIFIFFHNILSESSETVFN